jgi:hypothetical protein
MAALQEQVWQLRLKPQVQQPCPVVQTALWYYPLAMENLGAADWVPSPAVHAQPSAKHRRNHGELARSEMQQVYFTVHHHQTVMYIITCSLNSYEIYFQHKMETKITKPQNLSSTKLPTQRMMYPQRCFRHTANIIRECC